MTRFIKARSLNGILGFGIPKEMREKLTIDPGDVLSITLNSPKSVTVTLEAKKEDASTELQQSTKQ